MWWLMGVLPVLLFVVTAEAQELELFLKHPIPQQKPNVLGSGQRLNFSGEGYAHQLRLLPGMEVLDRLRFELPGVAEIAPPEAINPIRKEKLLDHFPRIGFYVLLDADMALYVTERYDQRQYSGKLVARKDILFSSRQVPADLAITVLDKDPYHRRTRDNFEVGLYGRLPFECKIGSWVLRNEISVGYDERSQFVALFRVHLGR